MLYILETLINSYHNIFIYIFQVEEIKVGKIKIKNLAQDYNTSVAHLRLLFLTSIYFAK